MYMCHTDCVGSCKGFALFWRGRGWDRVWVCVRWRCVTHHGVDSWYNFCILVILAGTATELHKLNSCTVAPRSECAALFSFVFSDKGNKNEEMIDVANTNLAIQVTEGVSGKHRRIWQSEQTSLEGNQGIGDLQHPFSVLLNPACARDQWR